MPDIVISGPWSTLIFVVGIFGGISVIFAGLRLLVLYIYARSLNKGLHDIMNEIEFRARPQELNVRLKSSEGDRFLGMSVDQVSAQLRKED